MTCITCITCSFCKPHQFTSHASHRMHIILSYTIICYHIVSLSYCHTTILSYCHTVSYHPIIISFYHPRIQSSKNPVIHTSIHTYIHTFIRPYIHTYTCIHDTYIHTSIHIYSHIYINYVRAPWHLNLMDPTTYLGSICNEEGHPLMSGPCVSIEQKIQKSTAPWAELAQLSSALDGFEAAIQQAESSLRCNGT
jgi:hypothetical protein